MAFVHPWHYWISYFLMVPVVFVLIAILVGYLIKVVGPKYTRR